MHARTNVLREVEDDSFTEGDWRRLLKHLGEDPARQGLLETPKRVEKAWAHWTSGYASNPADILKVFEDGAEQVNELILVRGIPVYSHCEHHLAPFFGTATIGYTPNGKIVGLSKLTRLVDCFAKRLQVQERLTIQVAEALMEHVQPLSVGVVIRCRHMCMESRGIQTPGEETVTSALLGEMRINLGLRSEFLALAREKG
jgi:GTP cyclohydrolase IA